MGSRSPKLGSNPRSGRRGSPNVSVRRRTHRGGSGYFGIGGYYGGRYSYHPSNSYYCGPYRWPYSGYSTWYNPLGWSPFYDYCYGYSWGYYRHLPLYCHPLNFLQWWWPTSYYGIPTYVYVNGIASETVVIDEGEGEVARAEKAVAGAPAKEKPSIETLVSRHVSLGDFYFKEGRYDEAAESYLRALAYAPEDASIHFILADALFALGDYHYAAFIISKALRLDPEMAKAKADKRKFYSDPKEFEKHLTTLRKYIGEKPFDPAAHLVLGYNLKFSDQPELAKKAFQKALEISPENQAAKLFLEAMEEPVTVKPSAEKGPVEKGPAEKGPVEKESTEGKK